MGSSPARRSLDVCSLAVPSRSKRFAKRFERNMSYTPSQAGALPPRSGCPRLAHHQEHDDQRNPQRWPKSRARAGVALSTVSYVLSGKRPVSRRDARAVMAAIEELDYRPHGPARALASGTSHTIALFLPSPQWDLVPVQQISSPARRRQRARPITRCCSRRFLRGPDEDRRSARERPRRRRHRDGDARRRSPHRRPPGERTKIRGDRPHGGYDRHRLCRPRLRRGRAQEPRPPRGARTPHRRALQLPARPARSRLQLRADRAASVRGGNRRARHPRHRSSLPPPRARGVRRGHRPPLARSPSARRRSRPGGSSRPARGPARGRACTSPTTSRSSR